MKYRVWHIPNVPGNPFHQSVESIEEAKLVLRTLARYDLYLGDRLISTNAQGLEEWVEGEWQEWHEETDEGRDISEVTRGEVFELVDPRAWR
jgi:hypothetical protein